MMMTEDRALFVIFFCLGVLVDFSELAEQTWLMTYSIKDTEWIGYAINFAWGPVRILFGHWSDRLASRVHPAAQIGIVMLIPMVAWMGILFSVVSKTAPFVTVLLLVLAEFGPAIILTIVESIMVKYIRSTNVQLSPTCRRYQLLGKALGGYAGSVLLHHTSEYQVFLMQWGLVTSAALFYVWDVMPQLHHDPPVVDANDPEEPEQQQQQTKTTDTDNRHYVIFMVLISMMPIGKNAYFYYLFGPLGLTANEFGLGKLASSILALACTFTLPLIERWVNPHQLRLTVAWMFVLTGLIKLIQVVRYTSWWVDDFYIYLVVTALGTLADSLIWTHYVATCTRLTLTSEVFAQYMTIPTLGKVGRLGGDYLLLSGFQIDHDQYGQLPAVMMICYWASLTPFYFSLIKPGHK
jgi:Na+/melibiose symporter-like transporter